VIPAQASRGGLLLVDGRVGRVPVKAILDTGAERSIGNEALKDALAQYSRRPRDVVMSTVVGATPQVVQGMSFETPAITIGGARLTNLVVTFGDMHVFGIWALDDEPALLIGMDLLGALERFVVDYPQSEFHLKARSRRLPGVKRCGANECISRIPEG
jgi:predicted aspartyl protease